MGPRVSWDDDDDDVGYLNDPNISTMAQNMALGGGQAGQVMQWDADENAANWVTLDDDGVADRLDRIEKRLEILTHNVKLEDLYPELKELGDQYKALEAKLTTFQILKEGEK